MFAVAAWCYGNVWGTFPCGSLVALDRFDASLLALADFGSSLPCSPCVCVCNTLNLDSLLERLSIAGD